MGVLLCYVPMLNSSLEKEFSLLLLFIVSLLAQEVYSGEKENQITEKRVPFVVVYGFDSLMMTELV